MVTEVAILISLGTIFQILGPVFLINQSINQSNLIFSVKQIYIMKTDN